MQDETQSTKCAFGVKFGKFLVYIVNQRDIKANLDKIQVLIKMWSPSKPKVQTRRESRCPK